MDFNFESPIFIPPPLLLSPSSSMSSPTSSLSSSSSPSPSTGGRSSRNTEKRRERSKVAARCRRGKESEIFNELSSCLPVPESSRASLDKASVMRLTLCDLKIRQMMENVDEFKEFCQISSENVSEEEKLFDALINTALSGFVMACTSDGDVTYLSDGISACLGLAQYEVMGQSLFEFSHPCDQSDIKDMLMTSSSVGISGKVVSEYREGIFRMKSANSTRGRNVHHRTTNYKAVHCKGRMFTAKLKAFRGGDEHHAPTEEYLIMKWYVGVCEPLLHPSDVDIPLNKQTFLSKHSPDMKFEYVDDNISEFLGYKVGDLLGKSLFDFYHACEGEGISRAYRSLYSKGQTVTERTRFLAKGGGWIWVVTQATTINNSAGKPTSVVCIHFVTSGVECDEEIVSHVQVRQPNEPIIPVKKATTNTLSSIPTILPPPCSMVAEKITRPLHESTNNNISVNAAAVEEITEEIPAESPPAFMNPFAGPILSKPTPSTAKIFAPRTDDMDTGFLMQVNDTLIVTKEEPEDLTHLAPIAGDECVPLSIPLLDDLLQWLDETDMEYSVLDGYDEDPLPIPLISSSTATSATPIDSMIIDSPIPVNMSMSMTASPEEIQNNCSPSSVLGNDDPMLEPINMSSPRSVPQHHSQCDSTLLSPDPLLLSPFKAPSPEPLMLSSSHSCLPSPACTDLINSEMFSSHYYTPEGHHSSGKGDLGGGLTAGASSHKSKAGGGYNDYESGNYDSYSATFPIVSDFQEHLYSPGSTTYVDEMGRQPLSPEITVATSNLMMDRNGVGGFGGVSALKTNMKQVEINAPSPCNNGSPVSPNLRYDLISKPHIAAANASPTLSQIKCISREPHLDPNDPDHGRSCPPLNPFERERPLPSKLSKATYMDEHVNNKAWLQIAGVAPPQPPWVTMAVSTDGRQQSLASIVGANISEQNYKSNNGSTFGTQTRITNNIVKEERVMAYHNRKRGIQQLVRTNPGLFMALIAHKKAKLNQQQQDNVSFGGISGMSRKRNFVGNLLSGTPLLYQFGDDNENMVDFSMVELTDQDCEVNAPLESKPLLDGPECLNALDT